jgi:hypothetical protein
MEVSCNEGVRCSGTEMLRQTSIPGCRKTLHRPANRVRHFTNPDAGEGPFTEIPLDLMSWGSPQERPQAHAMQVITRRVYKFIIPPDLGCCRAQQEFGGTA